MFDGLSDISEDVSRNVVAWVNFLIGVTRVLCNCTLPIATFPSQVCPVSSAQEREMETLGTDTTYATASCMWDRSTELQSEIISIWSNFTPCQGNNLTIVCTAQYFFLICFHARKKYFSLKNCSLEIVFENYFLHKSSFMWFFFRLYESSVKLWWGMAVTLDE